MIPFFAVVSVSPGDDNIFQPVPGGEGLRGGWWRQSRRPSARLATYVAGRPTRGEIVVLPGLGVASYLRPACDALAAEGFRARLVEPPGWPGSGPPAAEPASLSELATAVTEWLEHQDLANIVLVGQSMGAQLAAHVASARPDLVRLLVLQGPVFDPAYRTPGRALRRLLLDLPRERPSLLLRQAPEWLRVGPRRVRRMLRLSLADRLEDTLRGVDLPVLVVVGERDTLAGKGWASTLASDAAGLVVLPSLPHSAAHRDPTVFARVVAEHADRMTHAEPPRDAR